MRRLLNRLPPLPFESADQDYCGDGAHAESYWAASANPAPARTPLAGDIECETLIVGAGYSGLSTAIHLAERGHKPVVIEGAQVGWGASGRNGGQVINGFSASITSIHRKFGKELAGLFIDNWQTGAKILFRLVEDYGIDCDLKRGNIFAAFTAGQMDGLEEEVSYWSRRGFSDFEMLDGAAMRRHVNTEAYVGGLVDHSGGHVHPLNLALGEAAALERLGGTVHEHTRLVEVQDGQDGVTAVTTRGRIRCKTLILCGNAYLGGVVPTLASRVLPVSSQVIATAPLGEEAARSLIPSDMSVEDERFILDYYKLSADHRLVFGGGAIYGGADPADIEARLRPNMERLFPQLAGVGVDYAWSGNLAVSFSRVPQIGQLSPRILFAHGYSGHGLPVAHFFGRLLADAATGDRATFEAFARVPWLRFPGGRVLRAPYSALGSWWYSLRDRLGV